jgi:hypothetical protein
VAEVAFQIPMAPVLPFASAMWAGLHEDLISQSRQRCRIRGWVVEADGRELFHRSPIRQWKKWGEMERRTLDSPRFDPIGALPQTPGFSQGMAKGSRVRDERLQFHGRISADLSLDSTRSIRTKYGVFYDESVGMNRNARKCSPASGNGCSSSGLEEASRAPSRHDPRHTPI